MSNRLNARRRRAARKAQSKRLEAIADNLRNGDREAKEAKSLRKSTAYTPGAERLTHYGRCRVMHNAQGSEPTKRDTCARWSTK